MLIFGSRALMLAAGHISPWRCGAPAGMLSPSISGKASLPWPSCRLRALLAIDRHNAHPGSA